MHVYVALFARPSVSCLGLPRRLVAASVVSGKPRRWEVVDSFASGERAYQRPARPPTPQQPTSSCAPQPSHCAPTVPLLLQTRVRARASPRSPAFPAHRAAPPSPTVGCVLYHKDEDAFLVVRQFRWAAGGCSGSGAGRRRLRCRVCGSPTGSRARRAQARGVRRAAEGGGTRGPAAAALQRRRVAGLGPAVLRGPPPQPRPPAQPPTSFHVPAAALPDRAAAAPVPPPPPPPAAFTYELCAGLVDKEAKSVEEIAAEEILEECGFAVPPSAIRRVM